MGKSNKDGLLKFILFLIVFCRSSRHTHRHSRKFQLVDEESFAHLEVALAGVFRVKSVI